MAPRSQICHVTFHEQKYFNSCPPDASEICATRSLLDARRRDYPFNTDDYRFYNGDVKFEFPGDFYDIEIYDGTDTTTIEDPSEVFVITSITGDYTITLVAERSVSIHTPDCGCNEDQSFVPSMLADDTLNASAWVSGLTENDTLSWSYEVLEGSPEVKIEKGSVPSI